VPNDLYYPDDVQEAERRLDASVRQKKCTRRYVRDKKINSALVQIAGENDRCLYI